jgi:hypothetical protein
MVSHVPLLYFDKVKQRNMRDNPTVHLTWIQSKAKEHERPSNVFKSSVKLDSLSCSFALLCIQVKCKVGWSLMFLCIQVKCKSKGTWETIQLYTWLGYKVKQWNMRDNPTLHLTWIQSKAKEHERRSFVFKSSVKLDCLSCSFALLCIQVKCKVG